MLDLVPSIPVIFIAAVGVAGGEMVRRFVGRVWTKRVVPDLDHREEQRKRERVNDETLRKIAQEFGPNGGTSLHDRIEQIEDRQNTDGDKLDRLADSVDRLGKNVETILDVVTRPPE